MEKLEQLKHLLYRKQKILFPLDVLLAFCLLLFILYKICFVTFHQTGNTMLPTYPVGATVLVLRYPRAAGFFHRGDIILFHTPFPPHLPTLMRIVGLPGERIMLEGGHISINRTVLDERAYLRSNVVTNGEAFLDDGEPKVIPQNAYVVMGDNRQYSADSRTWGYVTKDAIIGKVLLVQ